MTRQGQRPAFDHARIEAAYKQLGYCRGWTFMAVPEQRMRDADVAFVGLNPGGGGANDPYVYGSTWHVPEGNAYYRERWGTGGSETPIQRQIRAWHELLETGEDESFCAQFIPFRSPDWVRLGNKVEAVRFAIGLWTWVLDQSPATLFVTMGKETARQLAPVMQAELAKTFHAGWGKQTIDLYLGSRGRRLVAMPHPSRFTLFGRGEASAIAEAGFRAATGR